jgi:hypothetical protein
VDHDRGPDQAGGGTRTTLGQDRQLGPSERRMVPARPHRSERAIDTIRCVAPEIPDAAKHRDQRHDAERQDQERITTA